MHVHSLLEWRALLATTSRTDVVVAQCAATTAARSLDRVTMAARDRSELGRPERAGVD